MSANALRVSNLKSVVTEDFRYALACVSLPLWGRSSELAKPTAVLLLTAYPRGRVE